MAANFSNIATEAVQKKYSDFDKMPPKDKAALICGVIGSVPLFIVGSEVALIGATKSASAIIPFINNKVKFLSKDSKTAVKDIARNKNDFNVITSSATNIDDFKNTVNGYATVADGYSNHLKLNKTATYEKFEGNCGNAAIALLHMLALNDKAKPALFCATPYSKGAGEINSIIDHLKSIKAVDANSSLISFEEKITSASFSNSKKSDYLAALNGQIKERQMFYIFNLIKKDGRTIAGHATLGVKYGNEFYNINNQVSNNVRITRFIDDWMQSKYYKNYPQKEVEGATTFFHIIPLNAFYNLK